MMCFSFFFFFGGVFVLFFYTPRNINMEPKNTPLGRGKSSFKPSFSGSMLSFRGCIFLECGKVVHIFWVVQKISLSNNIKSTPSGPWGSQREPKGFPPFQNFLLRTSMLEVLMKAHELGSSKEDKEVGSCSMFSNISPGSLHLYNHWYDHSI